MQIQIPKVGAFPSPLLSKEQKAEEQYGLSVGQAIEGQWFNNNSFNFDKHQQEIQEWRSYAYGKQNVDRYKPRINPTGDNSMYNLDWSPIPIIPKFVNAVVNSIFDNRFEIEVKAIDPMALSQKEAYKNELVGKIINKEYFDKLKQNYNIDLLEGQQLPETMEEVDIHMNINFKQSIEIAAEIAIRYAFKLNDYDEETKKRIIEDIVVTGRGIVRDDTDPAEGVKIEYVDPEYFIHSATRKRDMTDCFYMGHVDYITIAELRKQAALRGATWADDRRELEKIAQQFAGQFGNNSNFDRNYNNALGYYPYDDYLVPVLYFEYLVTDMDVYEDKETQYGTSTFKKKPSGYKPPKKSKFKRTQYQDRYKDIYCGYYILKCSKIYGWQRKENQVRVDDGLREVKFGYTVYAPEYYKNATSSLVAKMIPSADAIQLAWLKMQVALANAAPDGYAIDLSALDAIDLGNGALDPMTVNDIYKATGMLVYRSFNEDQSRNNEPIRPLPSVLQNISQYINQIDFNLRFLREITGIVPEMDGQTKRDQLVGVTEIAIQGAKNSIGYVDTSIRNITRRLAEKTLVRIQDLPKKSALHKEYVEAVGAANMSVIDAMDELPAHKFGVDITVGKNDAERIAFERDVSAMVGAGLIMPDERYFILNIPNVKYAAAYLKMAREKREKQKAMEQQQNIMMQSQANAQAAQATEQAKVQAAQMMAQIELQKAAQMFQGVDAQKMNLEFQYAAQLQMLKNKGTIDTAGVSAMAKEAIEGAKEDRKDKRSKMEAEQQSKIAYQRQENLPPQKFTEEDMFSFEDED